jgi:hypothetical protein
MGERGALITFSLDSTSLKSRSKHFLFHLNISSFQNCNTLYSSNYKCNFRPPKTLSPIKNNGGEGMI